MTLCAEGTVDRARFPVAKVATMQARVASFVLLASAILITAQESLRVRLAPTPSPQGQTLEIAGANGRLIEIDASAGLRQWISVAATNGSNEGVRWTDTNSAFFKQRFYRARAVDQAELPKGVTPVFAAGDVVTKLVGTNGGSLTLTDAAGSQFTLVIPPGALPNDETIELRSVAALEGVSLEGGLQAMVDLRPEGLHFMKASFVTIKPARALQQSKFIPLSYQAGREVSLELARVIDGQVSFSIMHFSGYGFGHGSMQDLANLQRRTPPKDMRQAGQRITDYLIMRQRSADPATSPQKPSPVCLVLGASAGLTLDGDNVGRPD